MKQPLALPRFDRSGRPQDSMLPTDHVGFALGLVLILGLLLRMLDLGGQSLWVDELLTLRQGQMPGYSLWTQFLDDAQAALPMVLATLMSRVSENEAWLRLPSALLGALSIPLIYEVVRRFSTQRAGLIAALLLAVHPMHIDHSQEIRGYAFMIFFGLAATLVVLDAGRRPNWKQQVLLLLCGTGAGLSNLQGLLWMAGLALGLVFSTRVRKRDLFAWVPVFALIALVLSPWWTTLLEVHETTRLLPGAETGVELRSQTTWTPLAIPWAGFVISFGRSLGPTVAELHGGTAGGPLLYGITALAAAVVLITSLSGMRRLGRPTVEVMCWIIPAVLVAVVLAMRNVKPFNPRYVIVALPVLLLLVSVGIDGARVRWARWVLILWLGLTAVSLGRYWFDPGSRHIDVRSAATMVAEREGRDDLVLAPTIRRVFEFYWNGRSPVVSLLPEEVAPALQDGLPLLEPERRFIWYVEGRSWVHDPDGELSLWLDTHCRRVSTTELDGVSVILYDRRQAGRESPEN